MSDEEQRVAQLEDLVEDLVGHLDYTGWGDSWERECSEELRKRAEAFTRTTVRYSKR